MRLLTHLSLLLPHLLQQGALRGPRDRCLPANWPQASSRCLPTCCRPFLCDRGNPRRCCGRRRRCGSLCLPLLLPLLLLPQLGRQWAVVLQQQTERALASPHCGNSKGAAAERAGVWV